MAVKALDLAVLFLVTLPMVALANPSSGLINGIVLTLNGSNSEDWTSVCKSVSLYSHSEVFAAGTIRVTDKDVDVPVEITLKLIRPTCANVKVDDKRTCMNLESQETVVAYNTYTTTAAKGQKDIVFHHKDTVVEEPPTSTTTKPSSDASNPGDTASGPSKEDKPNKEDPTKEDTTKEDPTKEDPTKENPNKENPTKEDPTKEDPTKEDPTKEDPTKEDPTKEDPTKEDPTKEDPTKEDPTKEDPTKEDPTKEDPTKEDPTKEDPTREVKRNKDGEPNKQTNQSKRSAEVQVIQPNPEQAQPVFNITSSDMYILQIVAWKTGGVDPEANVTITLQLKAKNPHGYLSAVDFPAFVFYGIMTGWYAILSIIWFILMCCSYKDLVRLQFWIGAVLILGFLEKTFFVSEYSNINQGADAAGLIFIAEAVSAAKRALSRMLLIIVALGFGTVKPRLGDSLGKVLAAGAIYFIVACVDSIVRVKQETHHTRDTATTVTLALSIVLEIIIFYWIFAALVATRRALRLRKNYVKLSLYNHFAYTLIFAIIASLAFIVWVFAELNFPRNDCLVDWREVWLRDCFWHMLFCFILIIVMVLWRPSSNRIRFAYSLVNDQDEDEEEVEQGPNKNFETLKMRQVSRSEAPTPPTASSQVEDDLRWVEENLPTSAVDKALPLILDSDEEVMTTKFEMSKLN